MRPCALPSALPEPLCLQGEHDGSNSMMRSLAHGQRVQPIRTWHSEGICAGAQPALMKVFWVRILVALVQQRVCWRLGQGPEQTAMRCRTTKERAKTPLCTPGCAQRQPRPACSVCVCWRVTLEHAHQPLTSARQPPAESTALPVSVLPLSR